LEVIIIIRVLGLTGILILKHLTGGD